MKRTISLLLACALLFSCAKEMELPVQPVQETGMYTLTVSVYKGSALLGLVIAQASGKETVLSDKILGEIVKGDELTLTYLSPDYSHQDGTIAYIASHCDYAVATVTVSDIGETTASTTAAIFANQQAIVKFTLNVIAKPLSVTLPDQCLAVTPESARAMATTTMASLASETI